MDLILALVLFATSAAITPGPNNIMIMASGLNFGTARSLPHLLGICLGFPVMVILVGIGFGIVFQRFPFLHEVIKVVGILYLIYLAWRIANADSQTQAKSVSRPLTFWQSALFQWINPKAWIMASSAIAAYTIAGDNFHYQVLLIALVFLIVSFPSVGVWLLFGVGLQRFLAQPGYRRIFNVSMAVLLLLSVAPVVVGYFT